MSTLTVVVSTDYSSQVLSGIDTIAFSAVNDFVQAQFGAAQFDDVQIAANVSVVGTAGYNYFYVKVGGSSGIDGSAWTFSNWQTNTYAGSLRDHVLLDGSPRDDLIIGSHEADDIYGNGGNDTIRAGDGNDFIMTNMSDGSDDIDGGDGEDLLNLGRAMTTVNLHIDISQGGLGNDIGDGTRIASIERLTLTLGSGDDTVIGGDIHDHIETGDGSDFIDGRGGYNYIDGQRGSDRIVVSGTSGEFIGGWRGNDLLIFDRSSSGAAVTFDLSAHADTVIDGVYIIHGDFERISFRGGSGDDDVTGDARHDVIRGGGGNDVICGGGNGDRLAGGNGADTFVYRDVTDSAADSKIDEILDFRSKDTIDLSAIDAVTGGTDDTFDYIGTGAFSSTAGELRVEVLADQVWVEADIDGNGQADLRIILAGTFVPQADHFVL